MSFDYVTAIDVVMTDCTVVRTLRTRVALFGPSVRMTLIQMVRIKFTQKKLTISVQQSILLLKPKPWLVMSSFCHTFNARKSMIGASRGPVMIVDLAQNQNIWQLVEGVGKHANWFEHSIRVVSFGLF